MSNKQKNNKEKPKKIVVKDPVTTVNCPTCRSSYSKNYIKKHIESCYPTKTPPGKSNVSDRSICLFCKNIYSKTYINKHMKKCAQNESSSSDGEFVIETILIEAIQNISVKENKYEMQAKPPEVPVKTFDNIECKKIIDIEIDDKDPRSPIIINTINKTTQPPWLAEPIKQTTSGIVDFFNSELSKPAPPGLEKPLTPENI